MKADIKKIILLTALIALIVITAGCVSNQNNQTENPQTPLPTAATEIPQTVPQTPTPLIEKNNSVFNIIMEDRYSGNISNLMTAAKRMNKVAKDGEYSYLLNLIITCKSVGEGKSFEFDPYQDVFLSVDGVNYKAKSSTTYPVNYPEIQSVSLKEGQMVSGWLYFIVPEGYAKLNMNDEGTESNIVDLIYS
ncbi:MAG: hypothetical protein Q4Q53_02545 [Methanocorpusculum sp.]|nr:hypothetical protein [Methanocorpusculum sp.]